MLRFIILLTEQVQIHSNFSQYAVEISVLLSQQLSKKSKVAATQIAKMPVHVYLSSFSFRISHCAKQNALYNTFHIPPLQLEVGTSL